MRLNKYLSRCGLDSRRNCDKLIKDSKIFINGKLVTDFSYNVKNDDIVTYNNKYLEIEDESIVYILNKPKGYICTSKDPQDRLKVIDLIDTHMRLFTIGRLDRDTTGLILLTNDGDIAHKLAHPKYQKEKKYYVKTKGGLESKILNKIKIGIKLNDGLRVKADINLLSSKKNIYEWDITLKEGKNREIKRIFSNFDSKVTMIHRYSFGGIELKNLKIGRYKKITLEYINKKLFK